MSNFMACRFVFLCFFPFRGVFLYFALNKSLSFPIEEEEGKEKENFTPTFPTLNEECDHYTGGWDSGQFFKFEFEKIEIFF